jgi:hypothetical protein
MAEDEYPELAAIATLLKTLHPLKEDERARVINFVFQKLGIAALPPRSRDHEIAESPDLAKTLGTQLNTKPNAGTQFTDIRSLRDAKKPSTASQMVALVAYYLEHLAPEDERRAFVTADDIKPYFNQAGFELPSAPPAMTLKRVSFRGPALELREVLREVLDHLAPDVDVIAAPGFRLEKDRKGPTMAQKVRFILKARGSGKTTAATPEDSVSTVDAIVGDLTRSVYTLGSIATHVASERRQVVQVKRYIDAVLHDILEIGA